MVIILFKKTLILKILKKTVEIHETFSEKWTFLKMSKNEKKYYKFYKKNPFFSFTAYTSEKRRIIFLV